MNLRIATLMDTSLGQLESCSEVRSQFSNLRSSIEYDFGPSDIPDYELPLIPSAIAVASIWRILRKATSLLEMVPTVVCIDPTVAWLLPCTEDEYLWFPEGDRGP